MIFPTLYKRSVNNKITTWFLEVEDNKFRATTGYIDGVKTVGEWTECSEKNIGKKNGTTPEQQALAEASAMFRKKIEMGAFENIDDIDNPVFFEPMLAKEFEDESNNIKYPVGGQPKLDGIRSITQSTGLWSRNGKKIVSAPHIYDLLKPLFEDEPDLIIDGELYADKSVADFNKVISCVRKTKPTPADIAESKNYIKLYIYDLPSHPGVYIERYNAILDLFDKYPFIKEVCEVVETKILLNEEDVMAHLQLLIKQGYEGLMIRKFHSFYENKRSKGLLKLKEFFTDEFEVRGVVEGKGKLKGKVGKLLFDGFDSAVNGDHEYIQQLWEQKDQLIGKMATVRYQELTTTENPVPRFPKVIAIRDYE
jgi:DNA ligase-1